MNKVTSLDKTLAEQEQPAESVSLGSLLKTLRASLGLTQAQAAQVSGLSRNTLIRWEQGTHQPRLPELNALLETFRASPEQRTQALELIHAPRAIQTLREEQLPVREKETNEDTWVFTPEAGDLLRTMRFRRGMTQEYVAEQMRVRRVSVARWESGDRLPSRQHLDELLTLLDALPDERRAMVRGSLVSSALPSSTGTTKASFESVQAYFNQVVWYETGDIADSLKDLEFLRLEKMFAALVPYHSEARHHLIYSYSFHADWLAQHERYKEAAQYVDRVQEATHREVLPSSDWQRTILTAGKCAVHSSGQPRPERGIETLKDWLPLVEKPDYNAWVLSDIAKYMAQAGQLAAATETITQSCRVAQRCENPVELRLRRVDKSEILLMTGKPEDSYQALDLLPLGGPNNYPKERLRIQLCWSRGLLQVGETSEARKWLGLAQEEVRNYSLDASPVQALERQFT